MLKGASQRVPFQPSMGPVSFCGHEFPAVGLLRLGSVVGTPQSRYQTGLAPVDAGWKASVHCHDARVDWLKEAS